MQYRPEIDGLRALAVTPVILFHAGFPAFGGGFVGVDVFFVISGYLITSIIVTELKEHNFSLLRFYERRVRRILPALFFVMLICIPFAWLWFIPSDFVDFSNSLVAVSLFSSNILFWREAGYFETANELKPLLHTWSLAVEEQYYVIFPIFLMLTWKLGKKWIASILLFVLITSLFVAQWGAFNKPTLTFYLLPTRSWELLIGAMTAFYLADRSEREIYAKVDQYMSMVGLLLIVYSVFFFDRQTPFPGFYALVPTIGASLIILFAKRRTYVGQLLGSKIFVGIGLISYSAYLWHQPLFAFAKYRSLKEPDPLLMLGISFASIFLAYVTWKYIETPFRNRDQFNRRKVFVVGLCGTLLFSLVGLLGNLSDGFKNRLSQAQRDVLDIAESHAKMWDVGGCDAKGGESEIKGCIRGDKSKQPQYAIWGDSYASALVWELEKSFASAGKSFFQYTKYRCPASVDVKILPPQECEQYSQKVLDDIHLQNINIVIVSSFWQFYVEGDDFDNGEGGKGARQIQAATLSDSFSLPQDVRKKNILRAYQKTVSDLLNNGKRVVLIYPIPEVGFDVPVFYAKSLGFGGANFGENISIKHEPVIARNRSVNVAFDELGDHQNLIRIRPEKVLCDKIIGGRCTVQLDGRPLYFDGNHLSNDGARLVIDEVMKTIDRNQVH
jgi:peptidoglycan/LPS O-acetylase OafA/YrhL